MRSRRTTKKKCYVVGVEAVNAMSPCTETSRVWSMSGQEDPAHKSFLGRVIMDRNHIQFVLLSLAFVFWGRALAADFAGGTGGAENPYQIATAEQLVAIGSDPNLLDRHYILVADIDLDPCLPGGQVFTEAVIAPDLDIAARDFQGPSFAGTLDGQGHSIRNLKIDIWSSPSVGSGRGTTPAFVGLLGDIAVGGSVHDLKIVDANVCGVDYLGILAGQNHGNISRCCVGGGIQGHMYVGGITGFNHGELSDCVTTSNLKSSGYSGGVVGRNEGRLTDCVCACVITGGGNNIGGLVGDNRGRLIGCASYATIVVAGEEVGGLVGSNGGELSHCTCVSTVDGGRGSDIGGLVGINGVGADVFRCTSACGVSGESYVGGACGYNMGAFRDCSSTGYVRAAEDYSGGFVGVNVGTISGCYSHGGVVGEESVGGFSGAGQGSITCCYTMGVVTGRARVGGFAGALGETSYCYSTCVLNVRGAADQSEDIGGFAGLGAGIISCFWDTEASRMTEGDLAVGLPTAQMQDIQTYLPAGWDFVGESTDGVEDTWVMSSNEADYPRLAWEQTCRNRGTEDDPENAGSR
jgi:hypothetical protein